VTALFSQLTFEIAGLTLNTHRSRYVLTKLVLAKECNKKKIWDGPSLPLWLQMEWRRWTFHYLNKICWRARLGKLWPQLVDNNNKLHYVTEWDSRLAHCFALFWGLGLCLGLFSYFRCKIWHHILALQPRFLIKVTTFCAFLMWFSRY